MATSGAFEGTVNHVAMKRCLERKHSGITGYPCADCANEVRLEFLTSRVSEPITPSPEEAHRILVRLGFTE
jgi:hypothetical protein